MITNNKITYYHKTLNNTTKEEEWSRILFDDVWEFGRQDASVNKGYENSNSVDVRIPMEYVQDETIFKKGDIIAIGEQGNITKQSDLLHTEFYNVTSIHINKFGENPHVHLGGN